jgi:hypothetical protein
MRVLWPGEAQESSTLARALSASTPRAPDGGVHQPGNLDDRPALCKGEATSVRQNRRAGHRGSELGMPASRLVAIEAALRFP